MVISHFILHLKEATGSVTIQETQTQQLPTVHFANSIVGNLGAPLQNTFMDNNPIEEHQSFLDLDSIGVENNQSFKYEVVSIFILYLSKVFILMNENGTVIASLINYSENLIDMNIFMYFLKTLVLTLEIDIIYKSKK